MTILNELIVLGIFILTPIAFLVTFITIILSYNIKKNFNYKMPSYTNGRKGFDSKAIKQDIVNNKTSNVRLARQLKVFLGIYLTLRILTVLILSCFIAAFIIKI